MSEYRTVRLPEDLCASAERWNSGRFCNLEELLAYLLAEIVKDDGSRLDQAEEEMLQQRLKDLGYI